MARALFFAAAVALTGVTLAVIRSWQAALPRPRGRVGPPKLLMALPIALGALFAARASWGLFTDRDVQWLFPLAFGIGLIVVFAPLLLSAEVVLADGKLSGPASLVGPFTWYRRNTIGLVDVTTTAAAPYGYTYFESADGRRVYIGSSYRGATELISQVNSVRIAGDAGS